MTDYDRRLFLLIEGLTDCGTVWPLRLAVDQWSRERAKRVIAGGFAERRAELCL
jgi:hypothetical protein